MCTFSDSPKRFGIFLLPPLRAWLPFSVIRTVSLSLGRCSCLCLPHSVSQAKTGLGLLWLGNSSTNSYGLRGDLASGSGCCLPSASHTEPQSSLKGSPRERGNQDRTDLEGNEGNSFFKDSFFSFTRLSHFSHADVSRSAVV